MKIININEDNLQKEDIDRTSRKVRAILVSNDKILVANYGGVFLFPGGKVDKGETESQAIIRELKEETGKLYGFNELQKIMQINYYQSKYPTREGNVINRLITTVYYFAQYKGLDLENSERTEKETNDNFNLELFDYVSLVEKTNQKSDNPRRSFFNIEMKEVLETLRLVNDSMKTRDKIKEAER